MTGNVSSDCRGGKYSSIAKAITRSLSLQKLLKKRII